MTDRVDNIIDGVIAVLAGLPFVSAAALLVIEPANWKVAAFVIAFGFVSFGLWPIAGGIRDLCLARSNSHANLATDVRLIRWLARLHFLTLALCMVCVVAATRTASSLPVDVAWHLSTWVNVLFLLAAFALLLMHRREPV